MLPTQSIGTLASLQEEGVSLKPVGGCLCCYGALCYSSSFNALNNTLSGV